MAADLDSPDVQVDVAIAGGGIAGAWLLRLLSSRGYRVALFEAQGWGADQTLASQGMIHGGLKYALGGALTGASEAIADMPARWRACVTGSGEIDLRAVRLLSDRYYMFAEGSALGKLTTFFAAKALRGRIERLAPTERPAAFDGFQGEVYALNDFVLDTPSLLSELVAGLETQCWQQKLTRDTVSAVDNGWRINTSDGVIHANCLISCAGNGSARLLTELEIDGFAIQQRPLKQVSVRPSHDTALYAHCLTGIKSNEPRLTITSHTDDRGLIWYLGGKLATEGVARGDAEQIAAAQAELQDCVPWLPWQNSTWQVNAVDRAEPKHARGLKPDQAYAERRGQFIQCFPTKLTLAPDLGDRVMALLPPPSAEGAELTSSQPVPFGRPPWVTD